MLLIFFLRSFSSLKISCHLVCDFCDFKTSSVRCLSTAIKQCRTRGCKFELNGVSFCKLVTLLSTNLSTPRIADNNIICGFSISLALLIRGISSSIIRFCYARIWSAVNYIFHITLEIFFGFFYFVIFFSRIRM